jgi:hypothetical protein
VTWALSFSNTSCVTDDVPTNPIPSTAPQTMPVVIVRSAAGMIVSRSAKAAAMISAPIADAA